MGCGFVLEESQWIGLVALCSPRKLQKFILFMGDLFSTMCINVWNKVHQTLAFVFPLIIFGLACDFIFIKKQRRGIFLFVGSSQYQSKRLVFPYSWVALNSYNPKCAASWKLIIVVHAQGVWMKYLYIVSYCLSVLVHSSFHSCF